MTLTDCALAILREIESLTNWESEIMKDLGQTRARRAELSKSLDNLLYSLPRSDRRKLKLMIAKQEMPWPRATRQASIMTPKVAAVHDYLAEADDLVYVADLQRHLMAQQLSTKPNDAHTILARKVKQGMVERKGRGTYRVNPRHREIVIRRRREKREQVIDGILERR